MSCEPSDPAPKVRPALPLQSRPMLGGVPVSVLPAMMEVGLVMVGRSLASTIVPLTVNEMVLATPGGPALEASMAARSEPAPLSLRLMTVKVAILYYPAP